ncbi:MAG: insulinase family protein [Lachnospiraceae bacterium]|nr:insulinase family protein [Lachnospiraceae bacterium]
MKKMRKLLSLVLALAVIIGSFGSGRLYAHAEENPSLISAKVEEGSKSNGFTLKRLQEDRSINGNVEIWEHDKTGATVFLLINSDPERAFGILFKTEPEDNTGKLHILEHACCTASEKYPGRNVFFDLISQGFFTDTNASTWHSSTNYYIGSLDEKELLNAADYYLDCAFHGEVRNDRRYFDREAWRYVIASEDDPLEVTGVVYSEMKGILSDITSYALRDVFRYLYPDSNYVYESGGDPDEILNLTYEELVEFYNWCYHPSNCYAIAYGDIEREKWLEKFDSYFSQFEREEFTAPEKYVPKGNYGTVNADFPVAADTADLRGALIYIWDLPDTLTYAEFTALSVLSAYESEITSPIMQALNSSGIGSGYAITPYSYGDQKQFLIYAFDADTSRSDEFRNIIDNELAAILKSTIDKETIDCLFEQQLIEDELGFNTSGVGISCVSALTSAIEAGDVEGMILDPDVLEKAEAMFDENKILDLFGENVLNNDNKLVYALTPKPGLAEEKEAALKNMLAERKAAMSKEELQKVIADSLAYEEWNATAGTDPATLAKLITADPDNLDITAPVYDTKIEKKDGVTVATAEVNSDVSYYSISFDISNLSKTQARYLNEYIQYMGMSTTTRTQEQVTNDQRKYLNGLNIAITGQTIEGRDVPYLVISFYAFNDNLEKALDHIFDMLYNTDIENAYNASYIAQLSSYFTGLYSDPGNMFGLIVSAAASYSDFPNLLAWRVNGIGRYKMLNKALSSEENFGKLLAGMSSVRNKVVKRQNGIVTIVGSKDSRQASIDLILARFPKENKKYKAGTITKPTGGSKSFAMEMNTQASYLFSADSEKAEPKELAAKMMAMKLMMDTMYIPEFRFALGGYSVFCGTVARGISYTELYSMPEFSNSWKRCLETPDELEKLLDEISDEMLDGYKLSLMSQMLTPQGEWNMAANELSWIIMGYDTDPSYEIAEYIRNLTVEDLKAVVPAIRRAFENMGVAVIGTTDEIEANKDMFDRIYVLK